MEVPLGFWVADFFSPEWQRQAAATSLQLDLRRPQLAWGGGGGGQRRERAMAKIHYLKDVFLFRVLEITFVGAFPYFSFGDMATFAAGVIRVEGRGGGWG